MFILESRLAGVRELEFSSRIKEVSFGKKTHETDILDWGLQGLSPQVWCETVTTKICSGRSQIFCGPPPIRAETSLCWEKLSIYLLRLLDSREAPETLIILGSLCKKNLYLKDSIVF